VILDPDILELRRFTRKQDERRAANFMGMWLDPPAYSRLACSVPGKTEDSLVRSHDQLR
jgi:hypothetical protein